MIEKESQKLPATISVGAKGLSITAAGLAGFFTVISFVHTHFLIPSVINEARKEMRLMIKDHTSQTHPGTVRMDRFDTLMTVMQKQLDKIEKKVDGLADRQK